MAMPICSRRSFLTAAALAAASLPLGTAKGEEAHRWGMVIDVDRCFGCQSCTLACRSDLPLRAVWRTKIVEEEADARLRFTPMICQQCPEAACMKICPKSALQRDTNGIVRVNTKLCNGCSLCVKACPYGMISLSPRKKAVKCELCVSEQSAKSGRVPPCVEACASHARIFGDFLHPSAELKEMLANPALSAIEGTLQSAHILYLSRKPGRKS